MERERYSEWSPVSRRQALAGIGTVAAGSAGVALVGSRSAAARVSVESFDVSDAEFTAESVSPVVDVTVSYDYDAANAAVAELLFELSVGGTVVAEDTLVTDTTTHEGTLELRGDVTDSDAWSSEDFSPAVASAVERDLDVSVRFAVRGSDESVIVEDSKADDATVVVSHPQQSEYIASVGGSGSIVTPSE